jgi:uncharacterized protein YecT (DUF1311 family)
MDTIEERHLGRNKMLRHIAGGLVLVCLVLMPSVLVGDERESDPKEKKDVRCAEASTQSEINACAHEDFRKEDDELNRVYREILKKYKDDPVFIKRFRAAQQAWLKFRDAQFEARFPHILNSRGQYNYGSVFPMCDNNYKAELTHSRIEELRLWLDGVEEGDVCAGSLPTKSLNE